MVIRITVYFLRSQSKSASPGEPVTMESNTAYLESQPNIYETTRSFDGFVVEGDTDAGHYMEIQDATVGGKANAGQVSESDKVLRDGSPTYGNCVVGEGSTVNSGYENTRKPISIVKAADETAIMENNIYENGDGVVDVANGAHEEIWGRMFSMGTTHAPLWKNNVCYSCHT